MLRIGGSKFIRFKRLTRSLSIANIREGQEIEGFKVTQVHNIPELHLSPVIRLEHQKTGAQYLHLSRADDCNNAFAVAFRTSPKDSTGLPHILEHVTLCGSKHYPVRDPFFKMLNRSLASFMNAMTGPDYTVYPFSTPNPKDFNHLLSVYLDAVFNPLLRDLDFKQEGWRLEHENVEDANSKIVFRGVVFNEMKGVFADPQQKLHQELLSALLPSDTYAHVFGGEPLSIPNLTAQDLRNFHSKCYHPSNAKIVSYGNLQLESILKQLNHVHQFSKQEGIQAIAREKRWSKPRNVHIECPPDPLGAASNPEKQASIALAFLCGDASDVYETFSLQVLSELLLGGPTSVLHQALIEPGYGDGFASCTGFEAHTRDTFFAVGLQGVAPSQYEQVSGATVAALASARDQGFDQQHIEAILHRLELGFKCQSASFGLDLALSLLPSWNHGADPLEVLNVGALVARLRKHLQDDPKYLQSLLDKYFCSNAHQLTITMSPSNNYEQKQVETEDKLLCDKVSSLDKSQQEHLFKQGIELLKEQQCRSSEDISCLPTLTMKDLSEKPIQYTLSNKTLKTGVPVQICPQPTNGVIHFRALLDVSDLSQELRTEYLPLFLSVASRMGTQLNDYKKFDRKKQLYTSGLGISAHISEHANTTDAYMSSVHLSSVCLNRNAEKMMELWQELLSKPCYDDVARLESLVKSTSSELANGIAYNGHQYAVLNASSHLTHTSQLREQLSGLRFINQMKQFASYNKDQLQEVLQKLKEVANVIFSSPIRLSVNVDSQQENSAIETFNKAFSKLNNSGFKNLFSKNFILDDNVLDNRVTMPLPVGYLGRAILTNVPYTDADHAALRVAAQLLSAKYLHPEVREKGGAYGARASMSSSGVFTLFSYRDPEADKNTRKVFDSFPQWLMNADNFKSENIDEAKLSIFQKVDAPTAPGDKGMTDFLHGIDLELLQRHRLALQAVTTEDISRVTSKYLLHPQKVSTTLIGPSSDQ